jgi:hypothetical protein
MANINVGLKIFIKDMPADFNALNSLVSPNLPNTITDDNSMPIGKAKGTNLAEA